MRLEIKDAPATKLWTCSEEVDTIIISPTFFIWSSVILFCNNECIFYFLICMPLFKHPYCPITICICGMIQGMISLKIKS